MPCCHFLSLDKNKSEEVEFVYKERCACSARSRVLVLFTFYQSSRIVHALIIDNLQTVNRGCRSRMMLLLLLLPCLLLLLLLLLVVVVLIKVATVSARRLWVIESDSITTTTTTATAAIVVYDRSAVSTVSRDWYVAKAQQRHHLGAIVVRVVVVERATIPTAVKVLTEVTDAAVSVKQTALLRLRWFLSPLYTLAVVVEAVATVYEQVVVQVVRVEQGVVDADVWRYADRGQRCRRDLHRFVVDAVQAARQAATALQVASAGTQADAGCAGRRVVVGGVPMQPQLSVMSAFSSLKTENAEETD